MVNDNILSKVETGFSPARVFPGNGQLVDPAQGGYVLVQIRNENNPGTKIVAHSVKQP
jgi:hypothetical protein